MKGCDKVASHRNCQNKGVTATFEDIIECHEDVANNPTTVDGVCNVREELQNIIDLMDSPSPQMIRNTSNEADNEESITSTIYSSVLQVKHVTKSDSRCLPTDTPRDISQMSTLPTDTNEDPGPTYSHENTNMAVCSDTYKEFSCHLCPYCQYNNIKGIIDDLHATQKVNLCNAHQINNFESNVQRPPVNAKKCSKEKVIEFLNFLRLKRTSKESSKEPLDLYRINILQQANDTQSLPKKVIFDLIDNIPKPDTNNVATNTRKSKFCENTRTRSLQPHFHKSTASHVIPELNASTTMEALNERVRSNGNPSKVDVYYFDHGNSSYFLTTNPSPLPATELLAEKTEIYTTKFWAHFFGTINIGCAFFTSFFLQLMRFILQSVLRPLTIGLVQQLSDYFFKPLLTVAFNAVVQPPLIFLYNVATSLRDLCDPLAEGLGYFTKQIAVIFKSIRCVEVKKHKHCNWNDTEVSDKKCKKSNGNE